MSQCVHSVLYVYVIFDVHARYDELLWFDVCTFYLLKQITTIYARP